MKKPWKIKNRHYGPSFFVASEQEPGEASVVDVDGACLVREEKKKKKKKKSRSSGSVSPRKGGDLSPGEDMARPKQQRKIQYFSSDPDPDEPANKVDPLPMVERTKHIEGQDCTNEHEPPLEVDNRLGVNVLTDESSPPVSHYGSKLEEEDEEEEEDVPDTVAFSYLMQLKPPRNDDDFWATYDDPQQQTKVYEQLALYRIRAHELFWNDKELDIAELKGKLHPDALRDQGYFKHYERKFDWYFCSEYCERSNFDDYQRLVLRDKPEYMDWMYYHRTCTTQKSDLEYLQYYEDILKIAAWIADDMELSKDFSQRASFENRVYTEALKVAVRNYNIHSDVVECGIMECSSSIIFDLIYLKDIDGVYFEIWKRVATQNIDFRRALKDVYDLDLYPSRHRFLLAELQNNFLKSLQLEDGYNTHLAHIDGKVSEAEARLLIKKAVRLTVGRPKVYADYVVKKLEVAKEIGVIP